MNPKGNLLPRREARWWLGGAMIVLAIAIVFSPLFSAQFLEWDDQNTISGNPRLNPPSLAGVAHYWSHSHLSLYVPVTYAYWGLIASIAHNPGGNPSLRPEVFHVASVILHAISATLVYRIIRRLMKAKWPALIGAMLFALHPVQVEPVAWASGAKDLLGAMFGLLAIDRYMVSAAVKRSQVDRDRRVWIVNYAMATLAFALAMLAKPSAVTVPLAAGAIDVLLLGRSWRQVTIALAPWLVLAVPVIVVAKQVQPATSIDAPAAWARPIVAADAIAFYATKLVWPVNLTVDYGCTPARVLENSRAAWTNWIAPLAAVALVALARRRAPLLSAGIIVIVAGVLPVLGLVPFEFQQYSTVADHYLYPSMFGVALAVAGAVGAAWNSAVRRTAVACVCGVVILACALASFSQARVWHDSASLFGHALRVNPTSHAANRVLGFLAARRGDAAMAARYYDAALNNAPRDPITHFNLANLLLRQNRPAEALEHYRFAVE